MCIFVSYAHNLFVPLYYVCMHIYMLGHVSGFAGLGAVLGRLLLLLRTVQGEIILLVCISYPAL